VVQAEHLDMLQVVTKLATHVAADIVEADDHKSSLETTCISISIY
jgi:hypothetical protein